MYLTLTNTTPEPEAIGTPDEEWVDVLHTNTPYDFNREEISVLLIGDKPSVRDQFTIAAQRLAATVRQLLTLIAGRKRHAEDAGRPELVTVNIANHGPNAVRVILGDGTNDQEIAAGASMSCTAPGYLELRELGLVEQDDNQHEAS